MNSLSSQLPQELLDKIMEENWSDESTLRSCALVCHAFLPSCQAQLFSHIDCVLNDSTQCLQKLSDLLLQSPHLIRYIRSLQITGNLTVERDRFFTSLDNDLVPLLAVLHNLRAFAWDDIEWGSLFPESKAAIWDLCRRSNISELKFDGLAVISLDEFLPLLTSPGLKTLTMWNTELIGSVNDAAPTSVNDRIRLTHLDFARNRNMDAFVAWITRGQCLAGLRHLAGWWNSSLGTEFPLQEVQKLVDASASSLHTLDLVAFSDFSETQPPEILNLAITRALRSFTICLIYRIVDPAGSFVPWLTEILQSHGSPSTLATIRMILNTPRAEGELLAMIPGDWDPLARLLSKERFPLLNHFEIIFVERRSPDIVETLVDTAKREFHRLQTEGILDCKIAYYQ
ncbi:hypothetical protein C8R43DRAFT_1017187 [Mycena crocata]|nr:hypothetical protein C8R43DRAFT_1017187 [Mycena crocata]